MENATCTGKARRSQSTKDRTGPCIGSDDSDGGGTNGKAEQHSNVKTLVGHQKVVEVHTQPSIKEATTPRSGKQGKPRVEWHKIGYPIVTALSDGSTVQQDKSTV